MDRKHRYRRKQQLIHCKEPMQMLKNNMVARHEHILLRSTIHAVSCWREVEHQDCRSISAEKSHLLSEVYTGLACNNSSTFPKVSGSKYTGFNCKLPCIHLCIKGEKLTLYKRSHVQDSLFARAKSYSRCLTKATMQSSNSIELELNAAISF